MQNLKIISIGNFKVETPKNYLLGEDNVKNTGPEILPESLALQGGEFFIDGERVDTCFRHNVFYWERQRNGEIEKGCARLTHNGLMCEGIIKLGEQQASFLAKSCNEYELSYQKDGKTIPWCNFKMGVRKDESGAYLTYGELYFSGQLFPPSYCTTIFSVTEEGLLHSDISIDKAYLAFTGRRDMCWRASFDFSYNYEECKAGKFYPYIPGQGCVETPYVLTGNCIMDNGEVLRNQRLKCATRKETAADLKGRSDELINELGLSINDLFTLPAPNMSDVQSESLNTLYHLMLYYCDSLTFRDNGESAKWIQWFNKEKEDVERLLHKEDLELLGNAGVKGFLEEYAKAILTDMFANSKNETLAEAMKKAKGNPADKMLYYFKGSGDKCLAKNEGFNTTINIIMQNVYGRKVPGLDRYIESGEKVQWAAKLYERSLMSLEQLKVQRFTKDNTRANHLCMMLTFLDKEKRVKETSQVVDGEGKKSTKEESFTYGVALYSRVVDSTLEEMVEQWRHDDQGAMADLFKNFLGVYINKVLYEKGLTLERDALTMIKEELESIKAEYGISGHEELVTKCIEIADEFIAFAIDRVDLPCCAIFQRCRLFVCIGACACPLLLCGKEFVDWNKLTVLQKTEYIVNFVGASLNIFCSINTLRAFKILSSDTATIEAKINAAMRLKFSGVDMRVIKNISTSSGRTIDETLVGVGRYTANTVTVDGQAVQIAKWTKFSMVMEMVVRVLNVLIMGLVMFLIAFDLVAEYKDKYMWDSIKGIDIVQAICVGLSIVLEIVTFTLEVFAVACAAIPIIGAVVALIGIVFAIVSAILHSQYKPKLLIEVFIEQKIIGFVDALDTPTAEWLKANRL